MKKFPSIEQFRNIIRQVREQHDYQGKSETNEPVYQHVSPYPTIKFKGTTKLHGTNAGIVLYNDGTMSFQSRERVLSLTDDNAGFMYAMIGKQLEFLFEGISFNDSVAIYGEWCGQGIQKGVAIAQLPKMFVIFACKVDDKWVEFTKSDPDQLIFNINDFKTWEIDIDFNQPELSQNQLIDWTLEVENECPVGKQFGITGIGEGIVFSAIWNNQQLSFKSKGEKHSASKVKIISSVNVDEINSINEFVDYVLTDSRLQQGLDKLKEMGKEISQKSTGDFLRWIVNDVIKEEQDTIVQNKLDLKKINSAISNKARIWFFQNF